MLNEIPTIGIGIDYSKASKDQLKASESKENPNVVDLSKALFNTSFDDSLLDISNQSFMNESIASASFQQNEADNTITEILTLNENENNQINELWTKRESRSTSGSSSPSIDDLISKRKVKKYAIEADLKLVKCFDEIKPKLCNQVCFWFFNVFNQKRVYLFFFI